MALIKNEFQPYNDGAYRSYIYLPYSLFSSIRMVFDSGVNCCGTYATRLQEKAPIFLRMSRLEGGEQTRFEGLLRFHRELIGRQRRLET